MTSGDGEDARETNGLRKMASRLSREGNGVAAGSGRVGTASCLGCALSTKTSSAGMGVV